MRRWAYYTRLAVWDVFRLWPSVRPHVIVVAGICLPLLMLLGLKRGHVATLRESLLRSPTGRQVDVWPGQTRELLSQSSVHRLGDKVGAVEAIIPESKHLCTLTATSLGGATWTAPDCTLFATGPGDPILRLHGVEIPEAVGRSVVLGQQLADRLQAGPGTRLALTVQRASGERASLGVEVFAVVRGSDQDHGYLDYRLHDLIEQYLCGHQVAEFGWPSSASPAPDEYQGYLIFCEPGDALDREALAERGLVVEAVADAQTRSLYGLLRPNKLLVYLVRTDLSVQDPRARLKKSQSEVAELARVGVVIPWNPPIAATVGGRTQTCLGVTLPKKSWLRSYFANSSAIFNYDDEELSARATGLGSAQVSLPAGPAGSSTELILPVINTLGPEAIGQVGLCGASAALNYPGSVLSTTVQFGRLTVVPSDTAPVVVPGRLLAHLHAVKAGTAQYDAGVRRFVPVPDEVTYPRVRLYARTIDDVPAVVQALWDLKYLPDTNNSSRIEEIRKQDQSLTFLVLVVGVGVWLFGVFTVYNVLHDSTARKRGTIGILRVMGLSRPGVFYLIVMRATILGVLAGGAAVGSGVALQHLMTDAPPALAQGSVFFTVLGGGALGGILWLAAMRVGRSQPAIDGGRSIWRYLYRLFGRVGATAFICAAAALCTASATGNQPVQMITHATDLGAVVVLAVSCCVLGAILPAWDSSRQGPFDAILEGRFR